MMDTLYKYMDWPRIEAIVYGEEASPRDVMGPKATDDGVLLQGFFPGALTVQVAAGKAGKRYSMEMQDEAGYYAVLLPLKRIPEYTFLVQYKEDEPEVPLKDPYRYPCQITEMEEKQFLAGIYYESYEKLGAHPMEIGGVEGTYFAVWAPNVQRASVVGDFNQWDGRRCPMHRMPASGIFEIFLPGVKEDDLYKFEFKTTAGDVFLKADPYANETELPPAGASVVCALDSYQWRDEDWQKRKETGRAGEPLSICEMELTDWEGEDGDYRSMAENLAAYVKEMGYTHVELHPVMEHKGDAYATNNYFAPTRRWGSSRDFMAFVDTLHQAEIGVILDWTPAHFPEDPEGLAAFDGTVLYENEDIRRKYHPMWDTLLFNFNSPMVKNFLIANALFWMKKYHIDGLRMDDVDAMLYLDYGRAQGEWTPNLYGSNENLDAVEFLKHLNSVLRRENPGFLLIAQEDGLWPELTGEVDEEHLGFDYKWNRGWTEDFLNYIRADFPEKAAHHDELTLSMVYAYYETYVLTLGQRDVGSAEEFLESLPGSRELKEAGFRAALAYQICHPGAVMQLDLRRAPGGVQKCAADLLKLYRSHPALYRLDCEEEGFQWVQLMKYQENILTFLRKTEKKEETLLVVVNFSASTYDNYAIGVPYPGKYKEIFNSDAAAYGGSGYGNPRVKMSRKEECDEREDSIRVKVPALGCSIYSYTEVVEEIAHNKEARKKEKPQRTGKQRRNLKKELQEKMEAEEGRAGGRK